MKIDPERSQAETDAWSAFEAEWWDEFRMRAHLLRCGDQMQKSGRVFDLRKRQLEDACKNFEKAKTEFIEDMDLFQDQWDICSPLLPTTVLK